MLEHATRSHIQPNRHALEESRTARQPVNVGEMERWLSLIGGSALVLYSLRRSLGGLFMTLVGGALTYRGLTGHCHLYQAMGVSSAEEETHEESMIITP